MQLLKILFSLHANVRKYVFLHCGCTNVHLLTLKVPVTAADGIFFFFFFQRKQVLTFHVKSLLADDSLEMSRLVFPEKSKKKNQMSSATNFVWRLKYRIYPKYWDTLPSS